VRLRSDEDGGGEARGPCADDDQVDFRRAGLMPKTNDRGDLRVARVAQDVVPPDHDRRLSGRDLELRDERFGGWVFLQVEPAMRHVVARGEVTQAPRVG
jgi:hypothetical protein